MANRETVLMNEILIALGRLPQCRVWRLNSGLFFTPDGRAVRAGVKGCADITGLITGSGRRLEIEVKPPGMRQTQEQRDFQAMIEQFGGLYLVAHSAEEAVSAVLRAANSEGTHA